MAPWCCVKEILTKNGNFNKRWINISFLLFNHWAWLTTSHDLKRNFKYHRESKMAIDRDRKVRELWRDIRNKHWYFFPFFFSSVENGIQNERKTGKEDNSCPGQNRSPDEFIAASPENFVPSNDFPYFQLRHGTLATVSEFSLSTYTISFEICEWTRTARIELMNDQPVEGKGERIFSAQRTRDMLRANRNGLMGRNS